MGVVSNATTYDPSTVAPAQASTSSLPQQSTPTVTAPTTANNVSQVDTNALDPSKAALNAQAAGTGYTSTDASAATQNVDSNQTVQGQLTGIIDANSPLMQRAVAGANAASAGKGLINSSMAVGAAQGALYDAATPIATSDASTYASAAKTNADNQTSVNTFNAGQTNAAAASTAAAQNAANLQNSSQTNQLQSQLQQEQAAAAAQNASAQNDANKTDAANSMQAMLANQSASVTQQAQAYDAALKIAMDNADNAGKVQLAAMDSSTKQALQNIQGQYQLATQANSSMAQTYSQLLSGIATIMGNSNLDANAMQNGVNQLINSYSNLMSMQQTLNGMDLSPYIENLVGGSASQPTVVQPTTPANGASSPNVKIPYQPPSMYGNTFAQA